MQRRGFVRNVGVAAPVLALGGLAREAHAQEGPQVKWRMSTSWPKSLDTIFGSAEQLCARVAELTGGKFQIRALAGGDIVPPAQNFDAVSNGTVECNHVLASAYVGKEPAVAFDTGLPFGLNSRQHNAWMQYGGGMPLVRAVYAKHNMVNITCGNVGVQMGGFYRKPINTVADLKGLKMRIGGIGGMVLARLGAVPQQIPPADIYASLEKGTIDAAEWIGPYDDEKLGLHRVAKHYYAPGWWEGSASITSMVNAEAWKALPPAYRAAFECAANEQTLKMLADYDARNPMALKKLIGEGAKLSYFPRDVMNAAFKATNETMDELAGKSETFKSIYPKWKAYREMQASWFKVAELPLDNFTSGAVLAGGK